MLKWFSVLEIESLKEERVLDEKARWVLPKSLTERTQNEATYRVQSISALRGALEHVEHVKIEAEVNVWDDLTTKN